MIIPYSPDIPQLYRLFCELEDNRRMYTRYPDNQDYKDRIIVLSDSLDIIAYDIASRWADDFGLDVNTVITHLRSLMHHYKINRMPMKLATYLYTIHYYNDVTGKWMFRDGTDKSAFSTYEMKQNEGVNLLSDRPSNLYEEWD